MWTKKKCKNYKIVGAKSVEVEENKFFISKNETGNG